jgi:hypothetical protein
LNKLADRPADWNLKEVPLKTKWEGPFLYEPPSLDQDWFVWIKYQNPVTGKLERGPGCRFNVGFNEYRTKKERREHGRALIKVVDELLKDGWTPYEEYLPLRNQRDTSVIRLIADDRYFHELNDIRESTRYKYKSELNLFKKWLIENGYVKLRMNEVSKSIVTRFMSEMSTARGWEGKTYNNYLNDITAFFNYYQRNHDDIIDKVPTVTLRRARSIRPGIFRLPTGYSSD